MSKYLNASLFIGIALGMWVVPKVARKVNINLPG